MIEEGFCNGDISQKIIEKYLQDPLLENLEALILGCTHYPLIKDAIQKFYGPGVEVIDSSEIVANALKSFLGFHNLYHREESQADVFMVSDFTESFEESTRQFFGKSIHLELNPLWD
jgi:glutamate racemase